MLKAIIYAGAALLALASGSALGASPEMVKKGRYLVRAAGCVGCHTDVKGKGPEFGGNRPMKTPFGTYYSPNITPDRETGIGNWSDADFVRSMREGVNPNGEHYYPVFPFPTYTKMRDEDMLAIKAYLFSLKPIVRSVQEHQVGPPFGWRFLLGAWKVLNFEPGVMKDDPGKSAQMNRGAYLVEAVAHCGECHTPRSETGAIVKSMHMAGTNEGPNDELIPNITPDDETGVGKWTLDELVDVMKHGRKPDWDDVQGGMEEAVEYGLKYMTDEDLMAMAVYLKSIPAIRNKIVSKKKK